MIAWPSGVIVSLSQSKNTMNTFGAAGGGAGIAAGAGGGGGGALKGKFTPASPRAPTKRLPRPTWRYSTFKLQAGAPMNSAPPPAVQPLSVSSWLIRGNGE